MRKLVALCIRPQWGSAAAAARPHERPPARLPAAPHASQQLMAAMPRRAGSIALSVRPALHHPLGSGSAAGPKAA